MTISFKAIAASSTPLDSIPLVLTLALSMLTAPSHAQQMDPCGCNGLLPFEGSYGVGVPGVTLQIAHVGGGPQQCPDTIRAELTPRPPGQQAITAATLTCNAMGAFYGEDDVSFRDTRAQWELRPTETRPLQANTEFRGGLQRSDVINVTIVPPTGMLGPNTGPRNFTATAIGQLRAPPCICSNIQSQIDMHQAQLLATANEDLNKKFETQGNFVMSSNFVCYGGRITGYSPGTGFQAGETVRRHRDSVACRPQVRETNFYDAVVNEINENRRRANQPAIEGAVAGAATDPSSCTYEIDEPEHGSVTCQPQVWFDAMVVHEEVHVEQCQAMNASPDLVAEANELRTSLSKHQDWAGKSLDFLTASYLYFNNPHNVAAFESLAYNQSLPILQSFFEAHCSG